MVVVGFVEVLESLVVLSEPGEHSCNQIRGDISCFRLSLEIAKDLFSFTSLACSGVGVSQRSESILIAFRQFHCLLIGGNGLSHLSCSFVPNAKIRISGPFLRIRSHASLTGFDQVFIVPQLVVRRDLGHCRARTGIDLTAVLYSRQRLGASTKKTEIGGAILMTAAVARGHGDCLVELLFGGSPVPLKTPFQ